MRLRISALSPRLHSQFHGPFLLNDANASEEAAKAEAEAKAKAEAEAKEAAEKAKKDDTEGRISQLAKDKKELERQLKEFQEAKKADEEKKLQEQGEHQKLAEQYKNESATEKAAREAAENQLKAYEAEATARVEKVLEGVTDKDAKAKLQALIDGKPPLDQLKMLETVLALAGKPATFGNGTPGSESSTQGRDQKQARYDELLQKERKEGLSGRERQEKHNLMNELSKDWKPPA